MIFLPVVILAIIQGITEFLPISSSGHLVLAHHMMPSIDGVNAHQNKILDVAVHVGTLIAVMAYFYRDVGALARGAFDTACMRHDTPQSTLFRHIAIATIPVVIGGLIVFKTDPSLFDSITIMAWMTLIFGLVLYVADKTPVKVASIERDMTWKDAAIFGLSQMVALIPGVSRSGITMTAGRFMGYDRTQSARFSLLMGVAAISGAGLLVGLSLWSDVTMTGEFWFLLAVGAVVSGVTAYIAIWGMMRWISSCNFTPFVIYRVVLGVILLGLVYGGIIPQNMQG